MIESNRYPLPTLEEILSNCNNCVIFSHLDLSDAYLHVELDRLTPGIKSASGAFQRIMDQLCFGIEGAKAYTDHTMLASKLIAEHKGNLNLLLISISIISKLKILDSV